LNPYLAQAFLDLFDHLLASSVQALPGLDYTQTNPFAAILSIAGVANDI
jgi:hypothetical protein